MNTTTTIWVTEVDAHLDAPTITQYEAVSVRPQGATVLCRGVKVVIRPAACRKVWTDPKQLRKYVRDYVTRRIDSLRSRLEKLEASLESDGFDMRITPHEAPPPRSGPIKL